MAISSVPVQQGNGVREVFDVTATADGDTSLVIAHTLGVVPGMVLLEPIQVLPAAGGGTWAVVAKAALNITVAKSTAAGSGGAGVSMRVHVLRPHSIIG